jgi:hypothetical protein
MRRKPDDVIDTIAVAIVVIIAIVAIRRGVAFATIDSVGSDFEMGIHRSVFVRSRGQMLRPYNIAHSDPFVTRRAMPSIIAHPCGARGHRGRHATHHRPFRPVRDTTRHAIHHRPPVRGARASGTPCHPSSPIPTRS